MSFSRVFRWALVPILFVGWAAYASYTGTGPLVTSAVSGGYADGWSVTDGSTTDAAATSGAAGSISAKLRLMTSQLASIAANTSAPIPPVATTVSCTVLCSNLVVENAGPHNLYSFQASADTTLSGAAWWVFIFNATSLPANGASQTPAKCYAVPSGTTSFSGAFTTPIPFATGITIGVSTTGCFNLTASVHAFISGDAN